MISSGTRFHDEYQIKECKTKTPFIRAIKHSIWICFSILKRKKKKKKQKFDYVLYPQWNPAFEEVSRHLGFLFQWHRYNAIQEGYIIWTFLSRWHVCNLFFPAPVYFIPSKNKSCNEMKANKRNKALEKGRKKREGERRSSNERSLRLEKRAALSR